MKQPTWKKLLSLLTATTAAATIMTSFIGTADIAKAADQPTVLRVYDDQLSAEFNDYSWANHDLADATFVHGGTSAIRLKPKGDDALYLYKSWIMQVSDFPVLELWLNGGNASGQQLEIVFQTGGQPVASKSLNPIQGGWQKVSINLAELNLPNGILDGILIRGTTRDEQADVYLDDISFIRETVVTGLTVSPSPLRMNMEDRVTLAVATSYSDGTQTPVEQGVEWKSGNDQVAVVQNGLVTAVHAGKTTLTAQYGDRTATVPVTVIDPNETPTEPSDDRPGITVYDDALSSEFQDNSWANHDLASEDFVRTGSAAVRMDPSNDSGLYFYRGIGSVHVKNHDRLEFWINGGDQGGQQAELVLNSGGSPVAVVDIGSLIEGGAIPADEWTKVTVDLPQLKLANGIFDGILIRGASGTQQGNLYLDDIRLLERYVAPPAFVEGVLSQYGAVLASGDVSSLAYEARYSDGSVQDVTGKAQWTSSDPAIVDVEKGVLTAKQDGLAKITVNP